MVRPTESNETTGWSLRFSVQPVDGRHANTQKRELQQHACLRCSNYIHMTKYLLLVIAFLIFPSQANAQDAPSKDKRNPTVGAAGNISDLILPGSELAAKPLTEGSPIVLRITKIIPHGDSFRYDLTFHGLEPGKFNLADWVERKDGSSADGLPEIEVDIQSLLPSGQIRPNALETGLLPRLGGYRNVAIAIATLWALGLLGLIFLGRKKAAKNTKLERKATLAELLKTRIEAALENRMESSQYAELERMLFGFWRKRLGLENETAEAALAEIKQHAEAGPLMIQLEQWMHNPSASKDVNLAELVAPFKDLPADTPGFQSSHQTAGRSS